MEEWLRENGAREIYVCGLATDYCVKFTTLDAAGLGLKTHFIEDASRGVNLQPGDIERAIEEMKGAGIQVVLRFFAVFSGLGLLEGGGDT